MNQFYWCALKPVTVIGSKFIVLQSVVSHLCKMCLMHKTVVHQPLNLLVRKITVEVGKMKGKAVRKCSSRVYVEVSQTCLEQQKFFINESGIVPQLLMLVAQKSLFCCMCIIRLAHSSDLYHWKFLLLLPFFPEALYKNI